MPSEQICESVNFLRIVLCVKKKFSTSYTIKYETNSFDYKRCCTNANNLKNLISYVIPQSILLCGNGNLTPELTQLKRI